MYSKILISKQESRENIKLVLGMCHSNNCHSQVLLMSSKLTGQKFKRE
jgi:hypothetical protein